MPAQQDPKKTAQTIIDALPGNSLASKTAILSAGTGVSVWAISNELYVLNEESVVAFCLLTVFYGIFKYGGPMYKEWSDTTIGRINDILNTARKGHVDAVKTRIEDVKPLSNVVEITKGLFEVSKVNISHSVLSFTYIKVLTHSKGNRSPRSPSLRTRSKDRPRL